jgi:6-phosphogluconolactonase
VIRLFDDVAALSLAAAELVAATARETIAARGRCALLLAGGDTPRHTYELLAREPFRSGIPWEAVHLFWGDERCVQAGDPHSNGAMVRTALLDHLDLRPEQIHPITCHESPRQAAERYEAELRRFFAGGPPRFDLVILGLGADGHTASLFPGDAAVEEGVRWTAVTRRSGEEFYRVTVTLPLLNSAGRTLFLVTGRGKAPVLYEMLEADNRHPLLPAERVRPSEGELWWFADRAAAGLLRRVGGEREGEMG